MSVPLITKKIIKEWTDYNNHMNLSYYILVFDMGEQHFKEIRKILDKEDPSYKS